MPHPQHRFSCHWRLRSKSFFFYLLFSPPISQTLNIHSSIQTITVNWSHVLPLLSQHPTFLVSYWIRLVANTIMLIQVFIIIRVLETCVVSAEAGQRRKQGIKKIKNRSPPPHLKTAVVSLHQSHRLAESFVLPNSTRGPQEPAWEGDKADGKNWGWNQGKGLNPKV